MSRQLGEYGSVAVSTHWGGDDLGMCVQITSLSGHDGATHVQMTMREASEVSELLGRFIRTEAKRRRDLLAEQIRHMKDVEKTIFAEVAALPDEYLSARNYAVAAIDSCAPVISAEKEAQKTMLEDPKRTASPYEAPGECEPAPIDLDAATGIIIDAIERDHWAYGQSPETLKDWLLDVIVDDKDATLAAIEACRTTPAVVDAVEQITERAS